VPAAVLVAAVLAGGCDPGSPAKPATATTPGPPTADGPAERLDAAANRVVQVLNGVTDEASARTTAPQLRTAAAALAAAGKEAVAAAAADGPPPVSGGKEFPPAAERVLAAVDRLAKAPFAAKLKPEIDSVLDAAAEMFPPADRPWYESELKKRGLRT
jgi:hypothetical protein